MIEVLIGIVVVTTFLLICFVCGRVVEKLFNEPFEGIGGRITMGFVSLALAAFVVGMLGAIGHGVISLYESHTDRTEMSSDAKALSNDEWHKAENELKQMK